MGVQSEAVLLGQSPPGAGVRLERPAGAVPLGAARTPASELPRAGLQLAQSEPPGDDDTYRIGPGDGLMITVWRQPEVSNSVTVRPDGRITMPLVEDLYVTGMTPPEAAREIEAVLGAYVQDPRVTVVVSGFSGSYSQQIRVIGELTSPQSVSYRSGLTVLDVVSETGGLSPFAAGNRARILRPEGVRYREIPLLLDDLVRRGDMRANVSMRPGDIVTIPEGFFAGSWRFSHSGKVDGTLTDNVDLAPDGQEKTALLSVLGYNAGIRGDTARMSAAVNVDLSIIKDFPGQNLQVAPGLNGTSNFELLPDRLFLDANATISFQAANSEDSTSQSQANLTNRDITQTYSIGPTLKHRFGRFASAQSSYNLTQVIPGTSNASNSTTQQVNAGLESGPDFDRLSWSLDGSASSTSRSDGDTITRADASANADVAVTRSLGLLGSAGFELFDDGSPDNEIAGPTWSAGFRWQPSPDLSLQLTYGRSDGSESFDGSASHKISARTSWTVSYNEQVQTAQERLAEDLSFIAVDEEGNLIDTRTNLPFNPNTSPFDIDDRSTRTRRLRTSISHSRGPDSYTLQAAHETQEDIDGNEDEETSVTGSLSWSRQLSIGASLNMLSSVAHTDFADSAESDTTTLIMNAGLSYGLFRNVSANASYGFQTKISDQKEDEFTENVLTLGARISF